MCVLFLVSILPVNMALWERVDAEHEAARVANGMLSPKSQLQKYIYTIGLSFTAVYIAYMVKFSMFDVPTYGGKSEF